jgi:hydroxymethylpyrimidine/phosphomethylpyrimidine kinase
MTTPPVVLTIAGSDSGGGAGIQADLKTIAALGGFGTSAITAVTAQNTTEVRSVHVVPADFVVEQVETVLDDLPVAAVKTGMLATAEIVSAVAGLARGGRLPNLVVDPVMVASSGARLLDPDAEAAYRELLIPAARVLTPNRREAEHLVGHELGSLAAMAEGAEALRSLGCDAVIVKGGHPAADAGGEAVDVWCDGEGVRQLRGRWIDTANNHGTGCSFAAAVASRLAHGDSIEAAVGAAKTYVASAITGGAAWQLGAGHGPLDHFPARR